MLFDPKYEERLDRLEERFRRARAITPDLILGVISEACIRLTSHNANTKARVNRLIECGSWIDATLALLEIELPQWKVRRLVYDDGEWLCSISKQPQLPLGLDELAEAHHEILPLAILIAFLQARRAVTASATGVTTAPQIRAAPGYALCCDNCS